MVPVVVLALCFSLKTEIANIVQMLVIKGNIAAFISQTIYILVIFNC